jgi:hypothetical protein
MYLVYFLRQINMLKQKIRYGCVLLLALFCWACNNEDVIKVIEIEALSINTTPISIFVGDTITNKVNASVVINGQVAQIDSVEWSVIDLSGKEIANISSTGDSVKWIAEISGAYTVKAVVFKEGKSNQVSKEVVIKPLYNRIQIFRNSTLDQEFIFNDSAILKYEIQYVSGAGYYVHGNGYEKSEYHYFNNGRVNYIAVLDKENKAINEEYHYYDSQGALTKIKFALHAEIYETYWLTFDYGSYIEKISDYRLDTVTLNKIRLSDPSRVLWASKGGVYEFHPSDLGNPTEFEWGYTRLLISYDDHANPLYKFKDSRPLPIRMTPNNVSRIESIFIGQGAYALNWAANITYSYNDDGTPQSALWTYDFPVGKVDKVKYVYDKVRY